MLTHWSSDLFFAVSIICSESIVRFGNMTCHKFICFLCAQPSYQKDQCQSHIIFLSKCDVS